jgi:hypothetical protein
MRWLLWLMIGCAHAAPEAGDPGLSAVAFLTGHWVQARGPERQEEQWLPPHAGTMLGVARASDGERTVFFEFLRIEKQAEAIVYLASPLGRDPPTPFTLVTAEPNKAVFENPAHDHPQRITYWLVGEKLHAAVEKLDGSKRNEWTFVRR